VIYGSKGKHDDDQADYFVDLLTKAGASYGIVVKDPGYISVKDGDYEEDWLDEIDKDIKKNGIP
jgi:hypothetical protein